MSSRLAIAAVTAILEDLLNNGIIDDDLATNMGPVRVSAMPPDRVPVTGMKDDQSQLNLFLYQVAPNLGWRNVGYPSRDSRGERISNPPLALDLHYLLTAYGTKDLHAEILLGYAMQLLHETPVLTHDLIRAALNPAVPVINTAIPTNLQQLAVSDLADQIEQVKICPMYLSTEEQSKLWTSFQTNYRPTVAYQVSVVLIESKKPVREAVPVTRRNVYAVPWSHPVIAAIEPPILDYAPHAPLSIRGQNLLSGSTTVIFDTGGPPPPPHAVPPPVEATPTVATSTSQKLDVALPNGLRAGIRSVYVVQQIPMGAGELHRGFESNVATFTLRPVIKQDSSQKPEISVSGRVAAPTDGSISARVTIRLDPEVTLQQHVWLLMNQINAPANTVPYVYRFEARVRDTQPLPPAQPPPPTSDTVDFDITAVHPGDYLVRVQVEGAQSALTVNPTTRRFTGPTVTIA